MDRIIKASINIHAPAGNVWRIITDTETWPKWGPSVRHVRCRDQYITNGSMGYVQTVFGLWVPFLVSDVIFEQYWSWRIYHVKATGHRIQRIADDQCRLIFDMPLFMTPYWFVCAAAVGNIRRIAEAR